MPTFVWLDHKRFSRAIRSNAQLGDHLGRLVGKKDVRWLIDDGDHLGLLISEEGKPIASVRVLRKDDGILLRNVVVAPHNRGQGLCGELVGHVLEKLRATGHSTDIYLDVAPDNVPAIRCYTSAGFEFSGLTVVYDGKAYQRMYYAIVAKTNSRPPTG